MKKLRFSSSLTNPRTNEIITFLLESNPFSYPFYL
jgi:hypothetical protein